MSQGHETTRNINPLYNQSLNTAPSITSGGINATANANPTTIGV